MLLTIGLAAWLGLAKPTPAAKPTPVPTPFFINSKAQQQACEEMLTRGDLTDEQFKTLCCGPCFYYTGYGTRCQTVDCPGRPALRDP